LTEERKEEILNAFTVGDRPVREVMTDRADIVFLSTELSADGNLDRIGGSPHTRFPLIGDDPSDYRGIVYVPSVVDRVDKLRTGAVTFDEIAAAPMTISAERPISEAVDAFQRQHQELALVTQEAGEEVVGLITATDALEAVMGQIEDPLDLELGVIDHATQCNRPARSTCGQTTSVVIKHSLAPTTVALPLESARGGDTRSPRWRRRVRGAASLRGVGRWRSVRQHT